ncbi:MAG: hypothetical protein ACQGTM_15445 [bacterium]
MTLTYTVSDNGYTILRDGVPWVVQDGYIPYPGSTIEESAQNHIDQIIADQAAAEESAQQPSELDILGQTAAQLQLDNMQLNSTVDTLGAMAAQSQLDIMALKGGAS